MAGGASERPVCGSNPVDKIPQHLSTLSAICAWDHHGIFDIAIFK